MPAFPRSLIKSSAIALMLAVLAVVSFRIGSLIGELNSPQYDSKEDGIIFLLTHYRIEQETPDNIIVSLKAGSSLYRYSWPKDRVVKVINPTPLIQNHRPARRWRISEIDRFNELTAISTITGAGLVSQAKTLRNTAASSGSNRALLIAGGALAISGGTLGYWWSYKDARDYGHETFLSVIRDTSNWHPIIRKRLACQQVSRINSEQLRPIKPTETLKRFEAACKDLAEYETSNF